MSISNWPMEGGIVLNKRKGIGYLKPITHRQLRKINREIVGSRSIR